MKLKLKLIVLLTCLLQACFLTLQAQKKLVTNETGFSWESLSPNYKISNDGKYVWYSSSGPGGATLVLTSTDGAYKKNIPGVSDARFTEDSRFMVYNSPKGLAILKIGAEEPQYIAGATEPSLPQEGDGRWLAYKLKGDLYLRDLSNSTDKKYENVFRSWFNDQGTVLLLQTKSAVIWVNLADGRQKTICKGDHAVNASFDRSGTRLAFTAQKGEPINPMMAAHAAKKVKSQEVSLRYFQQSMDSAMVKVTNHSPGIQFGFMINATAPEFSSDGKQLIFKLDQDQTITVATDTSVITDKVDVWSYKDSILMSRQLDKHQWPKNYTATIQIDKAAKVIQLQNAEFLLAGRPGNQYALVHNNAAVYNDFNTTDSFWRKDQIPAWSLVSLHDGHRQTIGQQPKGYTHLTLSPAEHYVCWFDTLSKQYRVYDIAAGTTRSISSVVRSALYTLENNEEAPGPYGIAGWLAGDEAVLVYDQYDIWQLDPRGFKAPINLTAGYGTAHHTILRLAADNNSLRSLRSGEPILLAVLDDEMHNGFCKIKTGVSATPRPGNLQSCLFYFPGMFNQASSSPLKAKDAEIYVMQRQSATETPNIVVTKDFKTFTKLSDINPQRDYNWMTSELLHWKMTDGRLGTGILYKPENFDPNKKYPVIVYYYGKLSQALYQFQAPILSEADLSVPWYVSNGYLVFIPDIIRFTGSQTEQILNSVESGAKYLTSLPYVDATKMGLQGHSFGGYETNVIITHSNLFAAAQSSSGISDLVSCHGALGFGGYSLNFLLESGEFNFGTGKTPWQYPELYRLNSPIFFVDKITTPLLLMANKEDGAVPFAQSVELFTALRRLQKPVWMLQYDGEGHTIGDFDNQRDFAVRQEQFFDHYLKGKLAPKWMTKSIPAKDKGLVSGLQLDTSGKQP